MQLTPICAPVIGNVVAVLWLYDEGAHAAVVWHVLQSVENFAVRWFGFVVAVNLVWWQLTHAVGVPPAYPLVWQLAQVTVAWDPVNGNVVFVLWSNVDFVQSLWVWQIKQSVGNWDTKWAGLVVAEYCDIWQSIHLVPIGSKRNSEADLWHW